MICPFCKEELLSEFGEMKLAACVRCGTSWLDGVLLSTRRKDDTNISGYKWTQVPPGAMVVMEGAGT